ncbi:MAG: tRNA (adenosine(37)-N6)-threonylcarbamoyltransferase complex ATPase subunit type 1 TsaE [Devosia sp.]
MGIERIFLADDAATAALGARLASELAPGDLVRLAGGLGAGKTALARALIRALAGDQRLDVPSPSFALVQPYDTPAGPVLHADLYRLAGEREIDELGLFDSDRAIVIVEWPERAPDLAARADVAVTLSIPADGNGRIVEIAR